MGSRWSGSPSKRGLLMETRQDIITFITEELDVRISSWDDYNTALRHIALITEVADVTLGDFLAQDPTTFECVQWRRMCGVAGSHHSEPNFTPKRSKLYYYAKLRAVEVVRGVDAHLNNCETLFAKQSLRQCIRVYLLLRRTPSPSLPALVAVQSRTRSVTRKNLWSESCRVNCGLW